MKTAVRTPAAFPPVVSKAVEESATAFFRGSCGLVHDPEADADADAESAGIMSTISFLGDPRWAFALAFPEDAAVKIAKAFAGFDIEFDSPDMGDVVGEIVNVIAGDISGRLAKQGINAQMSLPTTVCGDDVSLLVPSGASATRLTFSGPQGTCWFNLVGTEVSTQANASRHELSPDRLPVPPSVPAACVTQTVQVPPPPSAEALAAWAAAEAEAERELAKQDAAREAAEAIRLASGQTSEQVAATPPAPQRAPVRGCSRLPFYTAVLFACAGWGATGSIAVISSHRLPAPPGDVASPTEAVSARLVRIDELIRAGQFGDGLRECLDAPKNTPGVSAPALAFREGLCLEALGNWVEAARAYRDAEADPNVAAWARAMLGQSRCALALDQGLLARTLADRALLRSGHPDCHGMQVDQESRALRARSTFRVLGGPAGRDSLDEGDSHARLNMSRFLDWVPTGPRPTAASPVMARDVVEIHRTLDSPEELRITAHLSARPTIAVLRLIAVTTGWEVRANALVVAPLDRPVGPLNVDHLLLAEVLDRLVEPTGATWTVRGNAFILAPVRPRPGSR